MRKFKTMVLLVAAVGVLGGATHYVFGETPKTFEPKGVQTDMVAFVPLVKTNIKEVEVVKEVIVEKPVNNMPFEIKELGTFSVKGFTDSDMNGKGKKMSNREGVNIATDPNIIPYGTKVYIEGVGIRYAQPNMQVSGNEIYVYFNSAEKVATFGQKDLKVHIIGE